MSGDMEIIKSLKRTLTGKIILLLSMNFFIVFWVLGMVNHIRISESTLETAFEGIAGEARLIALHITKAYDRMRSDVEMVEKTPPVLGIVRSQANGDVDPLDGSTTDLWRTRLETIFASIMRQRPHYTQFRYIGLADGGREIVRVNRTANGLESVLPKDLQKKGNEPYFKEGLKLNPGEVYFSEVTFNREFGQVEGDGTPTVRSVYPVFDLKNKLYGMIVANSDYELLLQRTLRPVKSNKEIFVTNHLGDYIRVSSEGEIGSLEFHENYKMEPPLLIKEVQASKEKELRIVENDYVEYLVRSDFIQKEQKNFVAAVVRVTKDSLFANVYSARKQNIIISLVLALSAIVFNVIVLRWLLKPLNKMTKTLMSMKSESDDVDLPIELHDEIGNLARAFKALMNHLYESRSKATAVLNGSVDGIITIDRFGIVQSYNPACETIFGRKPEEVIGKNINMLMPEPYASNHDGFIDSYLKTGVAKIIGTGREVTGLRADGSRFPMELSVSEIRLNNKILFSGVVKDISRRKEAETQLSHVVEELKHSNEELEKFAYVASHDLKSPLRAIDNLSRWLEEDLQDSLNEENKDRLQKLRGRVFRMERLLDDLLDYSKAGHSRGQEELITLGELVDKLNETLHIPEGITVSVDDRSKNVEIFRVPIEQVFFNLINNAIKHHDKTNGHILVVAKPTNYGMWEFHVSDDGPGIEPEFHEKIFEMFQTLKPRHEVEGSGMGLAMVKKIVTKKGGRIRLESEPGKGTTFIFTWPVSEDKSTSNEGRVYAKVSSH